MTSAPTYASDAAKMTDEELADQIVHVVTYPKASSAGWRRAVAAEAAQRLRGSAVLDPSDETSAVFTYIVKRTRIGWQVCRRYENGMTAFVGGHNYAQATAADSAAARMNSEYEALLAESDHPAACGSGCRSQHTDDHSRCPSAGTAS